MIVVAGLLSGVACSGKGKSGTGGASGGGGVAGHGGTSGAGGAPITSCPASNPLQMTACSGSFSCQFNLGCTCTGCCVAYWSCSLGAFKQTGFDDSCGPGERFCEDGGAGTSGSGGSSGGSEGVGGNGGGTGGGTSGAGGGGMTISSCPASRPPIGNPCVGAFSCNYDDTCRCGVCCYSSYRCTSGRIEFLGSNDGCMQATCDAGLGPDGPQPVCTFGADQTCNDNPILSSIHGHCTDAGTCACTFDAGTNPDSGRCL
jgi:hypothetical protein